MTPRREIPRYPAEDTEAERAIEDGLFEPPEFEEDEDGDRGQDW